MAYLRPVHRANSSKTDSKQEVIQIKSQFPSLRRQIFNHVCNDSPNTLPAISTPRLSLRSRGGPVDVHYTGSNPRRPFICLRTMHLLIYPQAGVGSHAVVRATRMARPPAPGIPGCVRGLRTRGLGRELGRGLGRGRERVRERGHGHRGPAPAALHDELRDGTT